MKTKTNMLRSILAALVLLIIILGMTALGGCKKSMSKSTTMTTSDTAINYSAYAN